MTSVETGDYGWTDTPLLNGTSFIVASKACHGNERIQGTAFANQNGRLRIYQGISAANPDDYYTEIAVLAGVAEAWTVACVGLYCKIEFLNNSGADMTVTRFCWKLTSSRGVSK